MGVGGGAPSDDGVTSKDGVSHGQACRQERARLQAVQETSSLDADAPLSQQRPGEATQRQLAVGGARARVCECVCVCVCV